MNRLTEVWPVWWPGSATHGWHLPLTSLSLLSQHSIGAKERARGHTPPRDPRLSTTWVKLYWPMSVTYANGERIHSFLGVAEKTQCKEQKYWEIEENTRRRHCFFNQLIFWKTVSFSHLKFVQLNLQPNTAMPSKLKTEKWKKKKKKETKRKKEKASTEDSHHLTIWPNFSH